MITKCWMAPRIFNLKDIHFKCVHILKFILLGYEVNKQDSVGGIV